MYKGKRCKSTKNIWLMASVVMILAVAIGGTVAYIATSAGPVENTFTLGQVPITVVETFDGTTKENVKIKNEGTVDAYIRATVIANWVDSQGNIYGEKPVEGIDYELYPDSTSQTIGYNTTEWTEIGNYHYYKGKVEPNGNTDILFTRCKPLTTKDGYTLSVEILAQSIQAGTSDEAIKQAWKVDPTSWTAIPQP